MGTIQRQGLINIVIVYIGVALGFVNQMIVQPHFLHPDEVGLFRLIANFSGFLVPFLLVGSSNMCARFFPAFRNREKNHHGFLGFMLLVNLAGITIGGIVIWILKNWILTRYVNESPMFVNYFECIFPLAAIMAVSTSVNVYCNSLFKSIIPSFLNDIWVRIILILVTFIYAFGWITLDYFIYGIVVAYASQLILLFIYIFIIDKPGFKIDWSFVQSVGLSRMLRYSFLIMLSALSTLSMKFLDSIMIGAYLPIKFVGVFAMGAFMAQFIETPLNSLERIAGTKISHALNHNNMSEVKEIYYRSVRYLFLLGGFLAVCVICNVSDLLKLLPDQFSSAAAVTIVLSVGSIVNMATGVNSPILQNSSRYIWGMLFLFILLVLSVVLNMIFIPLYGMVGAAIATGLASSLYNLMKFLYIWKNFGMQPYDMRTLKTVFVILISLSAGLLLPVPENPWWAIPLRGTVITVIYFGMTFLLKLVPEYHAIILKKFLPRR